MQITGLFARLNTFLKLFLVTLLSLQGMSQEGEGILSYQSFCKSICYCPTFKPCGINCPFYIAWQEVAIKWERYLQTPEYQHHNKKRFPSNSPLLQQDKVSSESWGHARIDIFIALTLAEGDQLLKNLWFPFVVFSSVFLALLYIPYWSLETRTLQVSITMHI